MKGGPEIVGIIPARYASTRLPGKPLVMLCGKPMIRHVYERASGAAILNRVIVATDHEDVAKAVNDFGGEVMMTPSELRSGSDRVAYAAKDLPDADIIVNIQGDEPLVEPSMIEAAVKPLLLRPEVHAGTLVKRITRQDELENPNIVKVVLDSDACAIYFSRSPIPYNRDGSQVRDWHLVHEYYKHIGLYVFRKKFLLDFAGWKESVLERIEKLEQLRILEHGFRIITAVTEFDSIPVDVAEDVVRVQKMMNKKNPPGVL